MVDHVIGLLHTGSEDRFGRWTYADTLVWRIVRAAQQWFNSNGHGGDRIIILGDGHYADDNLGKLTADARHLVVNTTVPVIVAAGGPQSAKAVWEVARLPSTSDARSRVNIVFTTVTDPQSFGFQQNELGRGGNLTGMSGETSELDDDRLSLLHSYVSRYSSADRVGILINPDRPRFMEQYDPVEIRATQLRLNPDRQVVNSNAGINQAFNRFRDPSYLGTVVMADSLFNNRRDVVISAARGNAPHIRKVPAIYQWKQFVQEGGLMSYGPSIEEAYRTAGSLAAECCVSGVRGARPAWRIPITIAQNPELWINTATANEVGFPGPVPNALPNPDGSGNIPANHYP